jgi:hypothetical protein
MTEQMTDQSLTYVTKLGEDYYLSELREKLEQEHLGDYVVIEPLSKRYYIDGDLLLAIQEAEQEFPDSFFTIIKVGSLKPSTAAFKKPVRNEWQMFFDAVPHS